MGFLPSFECNGFLRKIDLVISPFYVANCQIQFSPLQVPLGYTGMAITSMNFDASVSVSMHTGSYTGGGSRGGTSPHGFTALSQLPPLDNPVLNIIL